MPITTAMLAALEAEFPSTYDEAQHRAELAHREAQRLADAAAVAEHAAQQLEHLAHRNATYYEWTPVRAAAANTPGTEAHRRTEARRVRRSVTIGERQKHRAERLAHHEAHNTAPTPPTYSTPRTVARWHAATRPGNVPAADALALALETIGSRPKGQRATLRDEATEAHAEHARNLADEADTVAGAQDAPTVGTGQSVRLKWNDRREVSYPARYTRTTGPAYAAPGEYPKPITEEVADLADPSEVLPAGSGIWLTASTGTVAHRTATDIDGKPIGTGGKAKQSTRPSNVPKKARKTNPVSTPDGRRRLWAWIDEYGIVQARTMSGHDVRLAPRNLAALKRTLTPAAERAATI